MKNLYKIEDELYIVSDKEKSSYCIKECPMAGLNIDRCDCQIFTACSNKVGNIILTTNKLLIKNGVQAIDDDFLEWFINNSNCEEIEVVDVRSLGVYGSYYPYKINIPKKETKQETLEEVRKVERTELFNSIYSVVKKIPRKDVDGDAMDAISCAYEIEQLFYEWQQERMYSEEEVLKIIDLLFHKYASSFRVDAKEDFLLSIKK